MRAIWSGDIAFGLVTIPTKLYPATRDLTPQFHLIHKTCGTRVQLVRRCPQCEKDLAWDEIDKAYPVSKDKYARFTKEELAEAASHEDKGSIGIVEFVQPHEVDLAGAGSRSKIVPLHELDKLDRPLVLVTGRLPPALLS